MLDEFADAPDCEIVTTRKGGENRLILGKIKNDVQLVRIVLDDSYIETGVWYPQTWKRFAEKPILVEGAKLPRGPWDAVDYRLECYLLVNVAHHGQADLYVTDDQFLLEYSPQDFLKVNVVSSEDAIAIIGAHLRNRHCYLVRGTNEGSFKHFLDESLFFPILNATVFDVDVVGVRMQSEKHLKAMTEAWQSIRHRNEQLLKSRDLMIFQLLQIHNNRTTDNAMYYFDMFLLVMGGALDLVARSVDIALRIDSSWEAIGWHQCRWFAALRKSDRALSDKFEEPSRLRSVLRLHALLRNTIHGIHLQSIHLSDNGRPHEGLMVIDPSQKKEASYLLEALGGAQRWGVVDSRSEELWIRPGEFIESLLAEYANFLKQVFVHLRQSESINWSQMPDPKFPFDADTRNRVKYLAGLGSGAY
jgi:hypothetical protein